MGKLKVLYISHEGGEMKGSGLSLLNLINSLGHKIDPIVVVPENGQACQVFKQRNIKYHVVPFNFTFTDKKGPKRLITFLPRYARDAHKNKVAVKNILSLIGDTPIDIVHSNSAVIGIGNTLAKALNAKHVWHLREFLNLDFNYSPVVGWRRFLSQINKSDAIICITDSIYNHYKMANNPKAYVLFDAVRKKNDVNLNPHKQNYLLFCGAISAEKGIEDALKAFSIVHQKHSNIKLLVAGTVKEHYFTHLSQLIQQYQIYGAVDFLGFQTNVDELMANALCLLMCSKNEAQGRVTIEAMFNGCPVVGFAAAGTLEIIKDGENGFLYHTIDEMVTKIETIIDYHGATTELLKKAQQFVQDNFSEETYSEKLFNVYQSLIN